MSDFEPISFGDKYVLVEHIATGGMAEIYRANYAGIEGFAKELVVKTLRDEFAARPEVVDMFLDEARVAATLSHNNVVHTYDLGEIEGKYFIAMELLQGRELVEVMREAHRSGRGMPLELALGIIMQICEGLHYVHTRTGDDGESLGLVHRDVNPTNIHVGYDGICKVLDFGIAATRASAVANTKGHPTRIAGKLAYMAPEQLEGRPLDQRADIFPLGVILYELCLGRRLFRGSREDVTRRVLEGDVPPPTYLDPAFPPALEVIIMRALEVDPAARYQNCDHLFRDLDGFLQECGLSWTARRISAFMVDLFGRGAPAEVDYDDAYDDLADESLDFEAFGRPHENVPEAPPDWARGAWAQPGQRAAGESGTRRRRALTLAHVQALVAQAHDAEDPDGAADGIADDVDDSAGSTRSPRRPRSAATVGQPPTQSSHIPPRLPERLASRTIGHTVVGDRQPGSGAWLWIAVVGVLAVLGYFAYSLLTMK